MKFKELMEAIVIGTTHSEPLRDNDTVRVYHGTNTMEVVLSAIKNGLSGDTRADRRYSYEANNNPKGLFVTPDIRTAKEFGSLIIEFHTRVRDLESPVWPNGTFTVQGGMTGIFNDNQERELERMRQRNRFSDSEMEHIRNSDRPELAAIFLASGERQALFTGNINPNNIKAVWMAPKLDIVGSIQTFERLSPRDFIRKIQQGVTDRFGSTTDGFDAGGQIFDNQERKLVDPRDDISAEEFVAMLVAKYEMPEDRIIDILKNNPDYVTRNVWNDRQVNRIMQELQRL